MRNVNRRFYSQITIAAFAIIALAPFSSPLKGATFTSIPETKRLPPAIVVQGELELGDEKKFKALAMSLDDGAIVFDSPGGSVAAGIEIGKAIRLMEYTTVVPKGAQCASACAIAWLGGSHRLMSDNYSVGFHAAYREVQGSSPTESGAANAVVGAYLSQIGLGQKAIYYLTSAPPQSMEWLSFEQASLYGIEVFKSDLSIAEVTSPGPVHNTAKLTDYLQPDTLEDLFTTRAEMATRIRELRVHRQMNALAAMSHQSPATYEEAPLPPPTKKAEIAHDGASAPLVLVPPDPNFKPRKKRSNIFFDLFQ
ncbi:hypothetical protein BH10PSE7_BH10PSE7_33180 [soil metagenome]